MQAVLTSMRNGFRGILKLLIWLDRCRCRFDLSCGVGHGLIFVCLFVCSIDRSLAMNFRCALLAGVSALVLLGAPGCAVTRGQQTVGAYVDDSAITTAVKARFVDSPLVDASAISVETLNGTVMLSGFAKNLTERSEAEKLTREVKGVRQIRNEVAVRP
jgi:hyperosmotically inducible periplasmic protein